MSPDIQDSNLDQGLMCYISLIKFRGMLSAVCEGEPTGRLLELRLLGIDTGALKLR